MPTIKFGADTSEFEGGIARAKAALEGLSAAVAGVAIGGAVAFFKSLGEEMIDLERNAKEAGLSLQKFQELQFVTGQAGVTGDKFVSSLQQAAQKLNDLSHGSSDFSQFLDANNVKVKTMDDYLAAASRLVQNAATEGDKFKAAALLGFSREWVEVLEKGPRSLQAATDEAHKLGIAIDDEAVHKAADFQREWDKSTAEWASSVKHWIIETAAPAIRTMISDAQADWANFSRDVQGLWGRITSGALFEASPAIKKLVDDAKTDWATFSDQAQATWNNFGKTDAGKELAAITAVLGGAELHAQKAAQYIDNIGAGSAQAQGYWAAISKEISESGEMMQKIGQQSFGGPTKFAEPENLDAVRAEMEEMSGAIRLAEIEFQRLEEGVNSSTKTFQMSEGEKTQTLLDALTKRQNAELEAIAVELNALDQHDKDYLAKKQALYNRSAEVEAETAAKTQQILDQSRQRMQQSWESMVTPIEGAFNSQLRGLLAGTTTWAQAMKNITADLVIQVIEEFERLAIVKPMIDGLMGSFGKDAPANLSSMVTKMVERLTAPIFAGIASFLAPMLGPAAIPAAAAATAGVEATAPGMAGSAAGGAWEIPSTAPYLLHPQEMVLPSWAANPMRAMLSGGSGGGGDGGGQGGGGDVHVHFNVSAMDAGSVQGWFTKNSRQIGNILRDQILGPK